MKITTPLQPTLTAEPNSLLPDLPELTTDPLAGAAGYRVQTDLQAGDDLCGAGRYRDATTGVCKSDNT